MLLAHIYKIDLVGKTATISWLMMGCGALMRPEPGSDYYSSSYCGQLAIPVDIYMGGFVTSFLLLLNYNCLFF